MVARVHTVTSTPASHSGRIALWLHLAATGVVLTTLMALLADLPGHVNDPLIGMGAGGGHGSGPANGGVAAPDKGGQPKGIPPAHPAMRQPAAGPVRTSVIIDVAQVSTVVSHSGAGVVHASPAQHSTAPRRVPRSGRPHGAAARDAAAGAEPKPSKTAKSLPVRKGPSANR